MKAAGSKARLVLPGETRVLRVATPLSLNISHAPPVTGALGVIGLSGRTSQGGDALDVR